MQKSDQSLPIVHRAAHTGGVPLSPAELRTRVAAGGRYVRFEFCISFLVATVRRQSAVYLTESWQERYLRGLGYSAVALLLGPWGVPWGLLGTARAVWTNLTGGADVTDETLVRLSAPSEGLTDESGKKGSPPRSTTHP
jgi:hypothetical protein